ncbi:MAG: signal peptide protein, partial [Terriglobales bacterium]
TQTTPAAPASSAPAAAPKTTTKAATATPSSSEIAAAKASGKVWVNTESGVYHKNGRWYGKTKSGKFMTEAEAKAAGYKEAQR